ncbi:MAG: hypothetical protein JW982_07685 [Spirochaetes bacterium]|nr:hypothetical protein [Spirochaetota bacterium]
MKHLTENEITAAAAGIRNRKSEMHISSCPECGKKISILQNALAPDPEFFDSIQPDVSVRNSVIRTWNVKADQLSMPGKTGLFRPELLKYVIPVFTIIIVSLSALLISFNSGNTSSGLQKLPDSEQIYRIISTNLYDSRMEEIRFDSNLTYYTDTSHSLKAAIDPTYLLSVFPDTGFSFTAPDENGNISIRILKGMLISSSSGRYKSDVYCSTYTITPAGTEFLVYYDNVRLFVAVREGSIALKNSGNPDEIRINSGYMWSSMLPLKTVKCSNETLNLFTAEISSELKIAAFERLNKNSNIIRMTKKEQSSESSVNQIKSEGIQNTDKSSRAEIINTRKEGSSDTNLNSKPNTGTETGKNKGRK